MDNSQLGPTGVGLGPVVIGQNYDGKMAQLGEDVPLEKSNVLKRQRTSFALSTIFEKSDLDGVHNLLSAVCSKLGKSGGYGLPPAETVKANFDAAFKPTSGVASSGVVVRNSFGEIMGANFRNFGPVPSSFAAEASATIHAIDLVVHLGFSRAIIEGDSLTVIKKLMALKKDLSDICSLIWDAKSKAQNLLACLFSFVSRMGNQAAHLLASADFDEDRFWVEDEPPSLVLILAAERCISEQV
ncbi:hypothetical protein V6N13_111899 [Hibiscus sabdariffa]